MLTKSLTSILRSCSLLALCLWGCGHEKTSSTEEASGAEVTNLETQNICPEDDSLVAKHLRLFIKYRPKEFNHCFAQYLKLRDQRSTSQRFCLDFNFNQKGDEVQKLNPRFELDSDQREIFWCLKQQILTMDFSLLQLPGNYQTTIELNYTVTIASTPKTQE